MHEVWVERFVVAEGKPVWSIWATFHDETDARTYADMLRQRNAKWKVEVKVSGNHKNDVSHREKPTF